MYRKLATELVVEAGAILLDHFGHISNVRQKEHPGSVVCEADIASEKLIVERIRSSCPDDGIVAEESGFRRGTSGITWVIDPLDGTSNFVAGIPWFGVQIGVLKRSVPFLAAIFLPVERALYFSESGKGTFRNGNRVRVTAERNSRNTLCAFGFDATSSKAQARRNAELLMRLSRNVRNTRATNSLVDFCYTMDGRFGSCINLNCKIWDIVPASLMLPEAGGRFTKLDGTPLVFDLDDKPAGRNYQVLGASRKLHSTLLAVTSQFNAAPGNQPS